MSITKNDYWARVIKALPQADSIAWDGCHKIYVQMDAEQTAQMEGYGYDPLLKISDIGVEKALGTLKEWFADSCGLRFIESVRTVQGNPNEGFDALIPQCEYDEADN
jgi:hypothetical protein